MPINCEHPRARFGFDLYRSRREEPDSEVCFETEREMQEHIERLEPAGNFSAIQLWPATPDGEWEDDPYATLAPDDFEDGNE